MAKEVNEQPEEQPISSTPSDNNIVAWVEKNNKLLSIGLLGALAMIIGGYFLYQKSIEKAIEGQKAIYPAQFYFGKDSLKLMQEGNEEFEGTIDIAKDYSGSVANLAEYYNGVAYLQQGKFNEAISSLTSFSSDDDLIQGRAYNLLGDAYLEKGDDANAIMFYQKAVDYKKNNIYTPAYILDLARAYEKSGDYNSASLQYQNIVDNYSANSAPGSKLSSIINDAQKYLGMAKAKAEGK